MVVMHVLFEHAIGYSLYRVKEFEDVGGMMPQVEAAVANSAKFMKAVKLVAFRPFENAAESLANTNAVSEGVVTPELEAFLFSNNFSPGNSKGTLGVSCPVLGLSVQETTGASVLHTGIVPEIVRGIRQMLPAFISGLSFASMKQAELGMGHAYSRSKIKFNVNRVDNMIIQGISINDQMDKDINTFAMRMREWYSYHFPELSRIVDDHSQYARLVLVIQDRTTLTEDKLPELVEIVQDDNKAQEIIAASRMSMGTDITQDDLDNIIHFTKRIVGFTGYRGQMGGYLSSTMNNVAPNLGKVVGDQVAARLISQAGSLTKLAKMPASTVQILGAEKALFRALKTKGNTPKYGLLYNSTFIGRANTVDKGRISRFLANKCSIASRIDCFSETLTTTFGEMLRKQVEDRLKFYADGTVPKKNLVVMAEAQQVHNQITKTIEKEQKKKSKKRKREDGEETLNGHDDTTETGSQKKKKKKDRKSIACIEDAKARDAEAEEQEEAQAEAAAEDGEESLKKKKKKDKKKKRESI